jgi:hypothetical protein
MTQVASSEIFERVDAYLNGKASLAQLDSWIVKNLEAFFPSENPWTDLALQIQVWVAELNRGDRDEADVLSLIQQFVDQHVAVVVRDRLPLSGAGNKTYSGQIIGTGQPVAVLQTVHR